MRRHALPGERVERWIRRKKDQRQYLFGCFPRQWVCLAGAGPLLLALSVCRTHRTKRLRLLRHPSQGLGTQGSTQQWRLTGPRRLPAKRARGLHQGPQWGHRLYPLLRRRQHSPALDLRWGHPDVQAALADLAAIRIRCALHPRPTWPLRDLRGQGHAAAERRAFAKCFRCPRTGRLWNDHPDLSTHRAGRGREQRRACCHPNAPHGR